MRMKTPSGVHFVASVVDTPGGFNLVNFGPKVYTSTLQKISSNGNLNR